MSHTGNNVRILTEPRPCCALGGGWVPVSSAEVLASKWEKRSKELRARAEAWEQAHPHHGDEGTRGEADGYLSCAQELRRQIAAETVRQPAPNK